MDSFEMKTSRQAMEIVFKNMGIKQFTSPELLRNEMDKAKFNSNGKLSKKMSQNTIDYLDITDRSIGYYRSGKRNPKEKTLNSMAEAMGIDCKELKPNEASVNQVEESLFLDDSYYWMVGIEDIKRRLHELSAEHVKLICNSYKEILSIPDEIIQIADLYLLLDKENQEQFKVYMNVLLNENNQSKTFQMSTHKVFDMFEKIACDENASEKIHSFDLFELLKDMFPNKEDTYEAESFNLYLYILLNNDLRKIAKSYLLLDSIIKKEMILRIADQMVITLEQ